MSKYLEAVPSNFSRSDRNKVSYRPLAHAVDLHMQDLLSPCLIRSTPYEVSPQRGMNAITSYCTE